MTTLSSNTGQSTVSTTTIDITVSANPLPQREKATRLSRPQLVPASGRRAPLPFSLFSLVSLITHSLTRKKAAPWSLTRTPSHCALHRATATTPPAPCCPTATPLTHSLHRASYTHTPSPSLNSLSLVPPPPVPEQARPSSELASLS
ncbi:hypothetical protein IF2G_01439 [Cordyceps javanica]|nr:hypothetical protein IF2G_01439 [Cordyceps javanica]